MSDPPGGLAYAIASFVAASKNEADVGSGSWFYKDLCDAIENTIEEAVARAWQEQADLNE